jgi:heat shock protein 5
MTSSNYLYEDDIVQAAIDRAPYKISARQRDTPVIEVKSKDGAVKQHSLMEVASMVIAELKAKAEELLGGPVDYAVHYRKRALRQQH